MQCGHQPEKPGKVDKVAEKSK